MIGLDRREVDVEDTQFLRIESRTDPRWRNVYHRLREIAAKSLAYESREQVLTPGDLVHEAYLRLRQGKRTDWKNSGHFFNLFARVMRHVLVDYHRRRRADKRPSPQDRVSLQAVEHQLSDPSSPINLDLKRALRLLEKNNADLASIVKHHYLDEVPLSMIALQRQRSVRTIKRDLRRARSLLKQFLTDQTDRDYDRMEAVLS